MMENTLKQIFPDDQPIWFVAINGQTKGPLLGQEVYQLLEKSELQWVDYVYRQQPGHPESKWIRLSEHPVFQALLPQAPVVAPPPPAPTKQVVPPPMVEKKIWFLFHQSVQSGPYTQSELIRTFQTQSSAESFLWKEGMTDWVPVTQILTSLSAAPTSTAPVATDTTIGITNVATAPVVVAATTIATSTNESAAQSSDRRSGPRKPLVARIYITNQTDLVIGLCRDISVGGMQVLAETVPAKPGEKIKLHVDPPADSKIKGFVAEGILVRVLEDRRGFSLRFLNLPEQDKQQIDLYIKEEA